ncbi:MAG: hypothetical protein SGJ11_08575 [Phycisphaerae bacterium]|nr:hypothetical protein [Phycisphaerae bacterium]
MFVLALFAYVAPSAAATITWDGGGGTLTWMTPANWSGDVLPGPNDDVVIDAAGTVTITLTGSASVKSLVCADALTINGVGTLTLATTATVDGLLTLASGALNGGAWTLGAGAIATNNINNMLLGVTLNGSLTLATNSAFLRIKNGLTLNGTAHLTGLNSRLVFDGTQTVSAGTFQLDGTTGDPARLDIDGVTDVTLGPSVVVEASAARIGDVGFVSGLSSVINQGTIRADTAGSTLTIVGELLTNQGTIEATAGTVVISPTMPWSNTGVIRALTSGMVDLVGPTTASTMGEVQNISGTVRVKCALPFAGETLLLTPGNGAWTFDGATLTGGALVLDPGAPALFTGTTTFDAMSVTGDLALAAPAARLTIKNGLALNGVARLTGAGSRIVFDGTQTVTAGTFELDGTMVAPARLDIDGPSVLTLHPGVLIEASHGRIGDVATISGASTLLNQGTIREDTALATLVIAGENFINEGTVEVIDGALSIQATSNTDNTGSITALGGVLRLQTVLELSDLAGVTIAGGSLQWASTINLAGQTLTFGAATGIVTLDGGLIQGGTLVIAEGAPPVFTAGATTFQALTVNGNLTLSAANASVRVLGGLQLNGIATLSGAGSRITFENTQTVTGGTFVLGGTAAEPARLNIDGVADVTFAAPVIVEASHGRIGDVGAVVGTSKLIHLGTMRIDAIDGTLRVVGEGFTNQGTVESTAGLLSIAPTLSWSNTGLIRAVNGGAVDLSGAITPNPVSDPPVAPLGDVQNVSGTIRLKASVPLNGMTLALTPSTGVWTFDGATLIGGVLAIDPAASPVFTATTSTFTAMTVNGDLLLEGDAASVRVKSGLALNGTAWCTGLNCRMIFEGAQTISSGSFHLDGTGEAPARLAVDGTSVVTFGPAVLMHGGHGRIGDVAISGGVSTVILQGILRADTPRATLTIAGEGFTNGGTVEATAGTVSIETTQNWANTGMIEASTGGRIDLIGPTTLVGLGDVQNVSGTVRLRGPIALGNGVLALTPLTGVWTFDGASVAGGTLTVDPVVAPLFTDSTTTFDALIVNGDVALNDPNATLRLRTALTLNGTIMVTGPGARLVFDGTQTMTGGTIALAGASAVPARVGLDAGGAVTFSPTTLITSSEGSIGASIFTTPSGSMILQGVLRSVGQGTTTRLLAASLFTNQGSVEATDGAVTVVENASNFSSGTLNGGVWSAADATLRFGTLPEGAVVTILNGECVLAGSGTIQQLSQLGVIGTSGVLKLLEGATLNATPASGTFVDDGMLHIAGDGSTLVVNGGLTYSVTAAASVALTDANQQFITASGAVSLAGTISITEAGGYAMAKGEQVTLVTGASLSGSFASAASCDLGEISYTATEALFTINTVSDIAADFNGDGIVGASDLAEMLGAWGACTSSCCSPDLNADGEVGAADLAILLGSWG